MGYPVLDYNLFTYSAHFMITFDILLTLIQNLLD